VGGTAVEAGGDDGHLDLVLHGGVEGDAEDHLGVVVGAVLDDPVRLVDLGEGEALASGEVDEDLLGPVDGHPLEERATDGHLGGVHGAVAPRGAAHAHERQALVGEHPAGVGEVDVDEARDQDEVGDGLDRVQEHLIDLLEGLHEARGLGDHVDEARVGDHDERVDPLAQVLDSGQRLLHPLHRANRNPATDGVPRRESRPPAPACPA
jgi:hypothetical protein